MGKQSRRRARRQQWLDEIFNDEGIFKQSNDSDDSRSRISFAKLFVGMLYTMLLYHISWLSDCGNKSKELKQNRQPFDDKVGANLSVYLFRRIYRMSRFSFDKLHVLLQPRLDNTFFPKVIVHLHTVLPWLGIFGIKHLTQNIRFLCQ